MTVLTSSQLIESAQEIAEQHVSTHRFNKGFAGFVDCDICRLPMPRKFSRKGKPFSTTKFYHLINTGNGDIRFAHNNLRICFEKIEGKKWGAS